MSNWETTAAAKRNSVNALIPKEWLIESIPSAEEQRDVTGDYIQQYLSAREVEITTKDAETIVGYTSTGAWKAREVTEAFCHRAALAHQLVLYKPTLGYAENFANTSRSTASMKYSSRQRLRMHKSWMTTMLKIESLSVPCMVSQSP
jgi:hypothetical protein